jgi:general stress protein 26
MPPARSCVVLRRGVLRGDTARSRGPLTAVQTEALAGQRCGMVTGTADETGAIRDEFGSAGPSQRWKPGRSSRFSGQYRLCHRQATGRGTSMITPATTLDHRYSAPGAVATGWDETRIVLETAELFWISTVRADGRPHVTPLVAVWADGALHFSTGAEEQKAINLRANPHVILTTGSNDWKRGLDVVVEGDAVRVTDDDVLRRLAKVWATKWDGAWQFQVHDGYFHHPHGGTALVFSLTPAKVLAFAKDNFSHTSHKF